MFGILGRRLAVLRRRRIVVLVGVDVASIVAATLALLVVRYSDVDGAAIPTRAALEVAAFTVLVHLLLCWSVKLYRGRAIVGGTDETLLLCSVALANSVATSLLNIVIDPQPIARSVAFGAPLIAVVIMIVARAVWRAAAVRSGIDLSIEPARTIVVGAGDAGLQLIRSMLSPGSPYLPIGLVDDDPWRRHLRLHGVSMMGTIADIERVVADAHADCVVIAIPSADSDLIREVSSRCTSAGVDVKVLPSVSELLDGTVSIRDVRDINIADLLGRSAIETDIASVAHFLNGKRVLVTGAGGSIGSELARQIAKWNPAELMMLDRDESGLHGVQLSIQGRALLDSRDVILCDIRDAESLNRIFEDRRPEVVFHAAALKHLPVLEQYPLEAVKTNVIGTANVLEAAQRVGVERFVNISTDKAAEPTSILGYSKRVAERLTADYAERASGSYISVRFGNVLGSRGSVLTTFAAQIAHGGPVTVTHPDVTRYFMTIPEAVQLVLQAGAIGSDGEVLILDMGDPVRIDDVAHELIRQSGRDIEIVYTGLRDGEKMDEVLLSGAESDQRPVHPLISHVRVAEASTFDVVQQLEAARAEAAVGLLRGLCDIAPADGGRAPSPAGAA